MENYKVIPFVAVINHNDTTEKVAQQLQEVINAYANQGWEYVRLESVETHIAESKGCFGVGATPGRNTIFRMVVFRK